MRLGRVRFVCGSPDQSGHKRARDGPVKQLQRYTSLVELKIAV